MSDNESQNKIDLEIVRRVQRGDKSAFDLLVIKYQHKLAKLVLPYVHDKDDVLDVVQESFIKAYKALPRFRGDSAFYTWLYRIAINTSKNYLTAQSRRPPRSDVDANDAEYYDGGSAMHDNTTPEANLARQQVKDAIDSAISSLPEELKVAITLREFEAMSYDEIANVMDCPVGTVRSRIFRARETIDNEIKNLL
ncbi:MAG: RNA polymerase sigma factor RpoE [gamma proteobacterium symbiont of Bathyaustriella thionipta]|nr:RNA polymerase sigma factor RpoE [gamma proteobacterium symbiont of Bathyaustriella thionipta]MCU7949870.1 RNA polymerase sigma factor RpoE [gamma proteobacterium symbiont of Bathyaustriella thionipta]MCU7952112.1 RNA polymerase sigma factor RpoE [gamma proteobacterium symbiont of Bathyaustriella thionipta]MCU7956468.1 RNA polymerase sigma factor RpoE [gamma proteobacterium symbiont of Bathyaustriella thionipta]MCU7965795.1 RNA polymerase sigma factor RpoE [gamma proteobacterium symbiont of 